jgi:hypothetical protein
LKKYKGLSTVTSSADKADRWVAGYVTGRKSPTKAELIAHRIKVRRELEASVDAQIESRARSYAR